MMCILSSAWLKIAAFVRTSFTFDQMTTEAFSRNVGKLFSELQLVTDNLPLHSLIMHPDTRALNTLQDLIEHACRYLEALNK